MPKCSYLEHENNRHAFSAEDAQPRVRGRAMGSFFLLFTTGQNTAFSIPFSKIGLFLKAVKTVIRTMADRIAARGAFSTEEIAAGLAEPITVKAIESGRDADTGDKLLWIETTDSGVFAFRLSGPAKEALADALHEDE
jgi:hypothetical protein